MCFTLCIKCQTGNQLKIHLVHLLADEKEIYRSLICRGFKSKNNN